MSLPPSNEDRKEEDSYKDSCSESNFSKIESRRDDVKKKKQQLKLHKKRLHRGILLGVSDYLLRND
jgi:hypothetical protein